MYFATSSSSNDALNPVVPLRDTSTKMHNCVDEDNFKSDFCKDLGNVTQLKEFLETKSPDELKEMYGGPQHHAACLSRVQIKGHGVCGPVKIFLDCAFDRMPACREVGGRPYQHKAPSDSSGKCASTHEASKLLLMEKYRYMEMLSNVI